jgi:hypothetical protein
LFALHAKWLPGTEPEDENLARALFLEQSYWQKMEQVFINGTRKAWSDK